MTSHGKDVSDRADLVRRFETMSATVPTERDEVREVFSELGIDRDSALQFVLTTARQLDRELRAVEYRNAAVKREQILRRLAIGESSGSRAELLSRLDVLKSRMPDAATLYKELKDVPDEDLATLVAELEFLDASDADG